jgi:hypothetical protein
MKNTLIGLYKVANINMCVRNACSVDDGRRLQPGIEYKQVI